MEQQSKQRGQKPDGKRKQPKYNKKGELFLSFDQLSKIRANTAPGFHESGYSIVINIKSTGTEVGITKEPPKLSSIDDLVRLYAARRTIAGVEAQEKKMSNLSLQKSVIMRQVVKGKVSDLSKVPQKFSSEFVRLMAQAMFIDKHKEVIENVSTQTETNKILRSFLLSQIKLMFDNIENYLNSLMVGNEVNLTDMLRNAGVSQWLYNKLSASSIGITPMMNLEDFFFPKKAEKGLSLSVKELKNDVLVAAHNYLLGRSQMLLVAIKDEHLSVLTNSTQTVFTDETNTEVKKVLKRVVYVIPTTNVFDYAKAHNDPIRIPADPDLLTKLNVKLFSVISGAFPLDMSQKESIKAYMGIDASSSVTKSLRDDFLSKLKPGSKSLLDLEDKMAWDAFLRHLKNEFSPLIDSFKTIAPQKQVFVEWTSKVSNSYFQRLNPEEVKLATSDKFKDLKQTLDSRFTVRTRKRRDAAAKSRITKEAEELITALEKDEDYKVLVDDIMSYLLSFSDKALQSKAAEIMHAEYSKKSFFDDRPEVNASDDENVEVVDF